MAHFAEINSDNIVIRVLVLDNSILLKADGTESELKGKKFLNSTLGTSTWKQTSYNANFRKNFAGIGYEYREDLDAFIPFKPYDSWVLNETTCQWESPVEHPDDGNVCEWDEENQQWINCVTPPPTE